MAKVLFEWDYSKYPGRRSSPPVQTHPGRDLMVPNRLSMRQQKTPQQSRRFRDGCGCGLHAEPSRRRCGGMCFMQGVYMDPDRKGQVTSARPLAG